MCETMWILSKDTFPVLPLRPRAPMPCIRPVPPPLKTSHLLHPFPHPPPPLPLSQEPDVDVLPATLDAVSSIVDMVEPGMIQVWGSVNSLGMIQIRREHLY